MNVWQYLDRRGTRMAARESRILPSDFRGWLAFGLFVQSNGLFLLMWLARDLIDNQGFMTLASAVIVTGWIGGAVAFAYSAGKREGEMGAAVNKALDIAKSANGPDQADGAAGGAQAAADAAQGVADEIDASAAPRPAGPDA